MGFTGFTRPNISAWVTVPERFEHENIKDGVVEFSEMIVGAEIRITTLDGDQNYQLMERSRVSKIIEGKIYPVHSDRQMMRACMDVRILDWKGVKNFDGSPVVGCSSAQKMDAYSIPGLYIFTTVHGEILDSINEGEADKEAGNSFRWPDGIPEHVKGSTPAAAKNAGKRGPRE